MMRKDSFKVQRKFVEVGNLLHSYFYDGEE